MGGSGWLSPPATTTGTPAPSLRHLRRRPSPLGPPTSPTSIPPLVITEIALTSTRRAETSSRRGLARRARRTPSAAQVWRVPTWPASPQASSARALPPPPSPTASRRPPSSWTTRRKTAPTSGSPRQSAARARRRRLRRRPRRPLPARRDGRNRDGQLPRRDLMDAGEYMQWRSGRERGLLHQQQYRVQGGVLRTSCQVQIHNQRHVR